MAKHSFKATSRKPGARYACVVLTLVLAAMAVSALSADQRIFDSPGAAVNALVKAADKDDMNALDSILGSDARNVLSSGDAVADNNAREDFVAKYHEMHRLAYDVQDQVILYIGADNWPFPIPLTRQANGWTFATAVGKQELLYRRIGRNELYTIDVLRNLVNAQREYAESSREFGGGTQFAQKVQSDPGKHNGLYWPVAAGEPQSPIGPLIADAVAQGYRTGSGRLIPFHGYCYKILTRQGPNAPGGSRNYIVDGRMTGGFAFLAYPASYRASGVMTFMVNQDGVLVQKDLGPETPTISSKIDEFNPDSTWEQEVFPSSADGGVY